MSKLLNAAVALLLLASPARGEGESSWPEKLYNPKPAPGDLILPMPCGGAMTFRRIDIPSDGWLGDFQMVIGGQDERFAFAENSRYDYLSGSFTDPANPARRSFYMAKYELTQMQREALAGGVCPQPEQKGRLPAIGLSWFDAVSLAYGYTVWLLANAAERLPSEAGTQGFMRLATEAEWEYAARGGSAVSPAEFQDATFPMREPMHRYVWFQGTASANGQLHPTGLLLPNPMGLHDMLGNADEIVLEPFHLNKLNRLHGQAGGFIIKGGDYLTSEGDIRSAYRQEIAHFDQNGPKRVRTIGVRFAISVPVIASSERLEEIKTAWTRLPAAQPVAARAEPIEDPLSQMAQLGQQIAEPELKRRVEHLERVISANLASRNEQVARSAKGVIRLGAFLGRKIEDDLRRIRAIRRILKGREQAGSSYELVEKTQQNLSASEAVLRENFLYYADTVIQAAQEYAPELIAAQLAGLKIELQNRNLANLTPPAERFVAHCDRYRRSGQIDHDSWLRELGADGGGLP